MNKVQKKILYVEDEKDIREIVVTSLESLAGLNVKACSSSKEAIQLIQNFVPDLILLDVMLPGCDGPSLVRQLHSIPRLQNVPIIFVTAKVQAKELQAYSFMGIVDIIKKPFDVISLINTVKFYLE